MRECPVRRTESTPLFRGEDVFFPHGAMPDFMNRLCSLLVIADTREPTHGCVPKQRSARGINPHGWLICPCPPYTPFLAARHIGLMV
jgi:hypothetical protein